ncbi:MAG: transcription termination/antitermination protein NusA [Anaerolineaceae bacterium]|nr:transcription termination/antitermination protein NusA [Anaerolineaceae bacterium]
MKSEFALALNEVLEEKQLPREVIMSALENAMIAAYRKAVGASAAQIIKVDMDLDKGSVKIFAEKEVSDSIIDARTEVLLDEARQIDPNAQIGDLVMVESTPADFGRNAASSARQAIQQKIRDAEKNQQFEFFSRQVGEIISGVLQAVNRMQATIGLDLKAEGTMLRKDMIPGERFRLHERIRAYVYEVKDTPKGLQIMLSHTHRNFLRRLLENEVPEIYHGIVEIRSIAREPGQRAKVAVSATQLGIDPVGACVGQKGVRIQAIVNELHGEKIDVIEWKSDPAAYIEKAISPAKPVTGVYLSQASSENKTATVVVPEDQLSLAIGKEGQNARLAAKLTGWRIDIMSVPEAATRALIKLREDPSLQDMAVQETENMARVADILQKKEDGKALQMEENTFLARFVDRVEKRGEADRKQEESAAQAQLKALRASIDPRAFELPILDVPLKEHIPTILQEAGMESLGDLMLQAKIDPDKILSLNGIGPKAMEEILTLVETYAFPALESAPEAAPDEAPVVPEPAPAVSPEAGAEVVEPAVEEVVAVEEVPAQPELEEVAAVQEPAAEEKSFEELFKLESLRREEKTRDLAPEEEEAGELKQGKKGKGKKKKSYTVEYDPEKDESIVRYKHKNEGEWDEDW